MGPGPFVLAALMTLAGPFFPPSLILSAPRADSRRCALGAVAGESNCALIGPQWVATTAGIVAGTRLVAGRLRVRVGDEEFAVDQVVYHPRWTGGTRFDITLLKLTERVPSFPVPSLPGDFPVNVARIAAHAFEHRDWVGRTIGPSPLWDERGEAHGVVKRSAFLTPVRALVEILAGRTSND